MKTTMEEKKLGIILYGMQNVGKTTTLMRLAMLLAGSGTLNKTTEACINKLFKRRKGYKDARLIVSYKGKLVFIGTGGDTWGVSRVNAQLFNGNYHNLLDVYLIEGSGNVVELTNEGKNNYKGRQPDVCICACRPTGDSYGAIKALHSFSETKIQNFAVQLWLQKYKTKNSDQQAKEIIKLIDQFLSL